MKTSRTVPALRPMLSTPLALILATVGAFITANLYYAQPVVGLIGSTFSLSPATTGLVVTLTQLGYGLGLLSIVPLGDLFENRRLILLLTACCVTSLFFASMSRHAASFLVSSLCVGVSSVVVQILIPYVSHLAPEGRRGRIIGLMTSGQMLGIMLARPVAGVVAHEASWRAIFLMSALCLLIAGTVLWSVLPRRMPDAALDYRQLLTSMARLACTTEVLQRRAFYHATLFASFCLFWTVVPLVLTGSRYGLSQLDIACFSLVGAAGVAAAPIAGRVADRGWTRAATGVALLLVAASFPMTWLAYRNTAGGVAMFACAAVALGVGVTLHVVLGQRVIFALGAEHRSKLNGLFMAAFYLSGAAGSAIGTWAYARGGWSLASAIGFALPVAAAMVFSGEFRVGRPR